MDTVEKVLILAVGLIVTCIVMYAAISLANVGQNVSKNFANDVNERNASLAEAEYTQYSYGENTGSDVVSAIRKYRDDIEIKVVIYTSASTTKEFSSTSLSDSFQNLPTNSNYINPSAKFTCSIIRSTSDVIVGLKFQQVKYVSLTSAVSPSSGSTSSTTTITATLKSYNSSAEVTDETSYVTALSDEVEADEVEADASTSSDSDDVEIIFSDGSKNSKNTEKSTLVDELASSIANYGSQLDDLIAKTDAFDPENDDLDKLDNIYSALTDLASNLEKVKESVSEKTLGKEKAAEILSQLEASKTKVEGASSVIKKLKSELKEKEDSETEWYVGYPIREDVKVTLEDGVLTFSGQGETDLGQSLPKWLNKASKIKTVVFEKGVQPLNVDYWFSGCTNLKTVKGFPESVQTMNGTFQGCVSLSGKITVGDVQAANAVRVCDGSSSRVTFVVTKGTTADSILTEQSEYEENNVKVERV